MPRALLLLTALLHLPISAEGSDQLRLLNGDRIHGTLVGLERGRLLFTLSDGEKPLSGQVLRVEETKDSLSAPLERSLRRTPPRQPTVP